MVFRGPCRGGIGGGCLWKFGGADGVGGEEGNLGGVGGEGVGGELGGDVGEGVGGVGSVGRHEFRSLCGVS